MTYWRFLPSGQPLRSIKSNGVRGFIPLIGARTMPSWQEWVDQQAKNLGLTVTSGYRTPAQEKALGGPASSYHTRGTPEAPGAEDIGGPAGQLRKLFDEIRQAFAGRINELYLNIPGGGSQDIKNNQPLGRNPEAGRPQHLHVALGGTVGPPLTGSAPASSLPGADSGAGSECTRSLCHPTGASLLGLGEERCVCWSDVWMYGAAVGAILGGSWLLFAGKKG